MADADIETEVRTFIVEELLEEDDPGELPADSPLLSGLLDSWALMQLLNFLEERFEISISHNEVLDDNFATVGTVGDFIRSKLQERQES